VKTIFPKGKKKKTSREKRRGEIVPPFARETGNAAGEGDPRPRSANVRQPARRTLETRRGKKGENIDKRRGDKLAAIKAHDKREEREGDANFGGGTKVSL